jgi:hypothetical protein
MVGFLAVSLTQLAELLNGLVLHTAGQQQQQQQQLVLGSHQKSNRVSHRAITPASCRTIELLAKVE